MRPNPLTPLPLREGAWGEVREKNVRNISYKNVAMSSRDFFVMSGTLASAAG
jgi:hypothetical protein